jgi:hypothetical protein
LVLEYCLPWLTKIYGYESFISLMKGEKLAFPLKKMQWQAEFFSVLTGWHFACKKFDQINFNESIVQSFF